MMGLRTNGQASGKTTEESQFDSWQGQEILLVSEVTKPAQVPI
jgi:hypothetical protein